MDIKHKFTGTWTLKSIIIMQGNKHTFPFGEDVKGILFYSESHISVQLMMPIEMPLSEERKTALKLIDLAHTLKTIGYMGYFGTYDIDEADKKIYHHVEGAIAQGLIGGDEIRNYRFEGDNLILSTGPLELSWQRL